MKTDDSKQLYDKYYNLKDRRIEIVLKNGRYLRGVICGFFKGDAESDEPYIIKWHIVAETEHKRFGHNFMGCITGEIIRQRDILEIVFNENNKINETV